MSKAVDKFVQDLLEHVAAGLGDLLANEIHLSPGPLSGFSADSLKPFGDEFVAVLTASVTEPHAGMVYTAFDLDRVVVLGALLEMVPPEGIKERLTEPTFNDDQADAFEEVGNILIGKLDEVIRDHVGQEKIHTKKGDTLHGAPAEIAAAIQANGDYYCLDATIEIEGQEVGPVAFLFPPTLIEGAFKADPEVIRGRVAKQVARQDDAPADEPSIAVSAAAAAADPEAAPQIAVAGDDALGPGDPTSPGAREGAPEDGPQSIAGDERSQPEEAVAAEDTAEGLLAQAIASDTGAPPPPATTPPEIPRDAFRPRTDDGRTVLLVVDDDITTRVMIRQYLEGPDVSIYEAVSWREAGLFLRSHRVDGILLDLYLADLNGIDACRKLHLHPSTRHVPVVLCTSRPSREAVLKGLKAGAADFLIKPFTRDRLIEKLDTVLQFETSAAA